MGHKDMNVNLARIKKVIVLCGTYPKANDGGKFIKIYWIYL